VSTTLDEGEARLAASSVAPSPDYPHGWRFVAWLTERDAEGCRLFAYQGAACGYARATGDRIHKHSSRIVYDIEGDGWLAQAQREAASAQPVYERKHAEFLARLSRPDALLRAIYAR
jgi:hypothetical protein